MTSKKQSGFREIRFTLAMILGALMVCGLPIAAGASNFNIGSGIYDITGPAAELGMMGYSMPDQKTEGISMRLRARAFVVVDPVNGKRVAFVSADTGIIPQGVKQQVTKLLLSRFGGLYTDQNVLISANHTHSGPGAYSHYALYNLSMLGYDSVNFNCVANGIFQAIVRAHNNLTPGTILINTGQLDNCGWNRSPTAYNNNPAAERAQYAADTDKTMVLLKFVTSAGREIGALNWFAVHPTSLGNTNRLISGDNKGYASYLFEKAMGTNYAATNTFVAAFAQTNSGDVSPNIYWGYPNGTDDYSHMLTIGERQYQKAITLYDGATTALSGGVDFRYQYVDFSNEIITSAFMPSGMGGGNTCTAAIGVSMLAGSTEDGKGLDIPEGITYPYDISILGTVFPWSFTILPEDQACHAEKPIVLPMGRIRPQGIPLTPEVLPVQILKIGNLAIVGHPTEITTMAGRRLRETVQTALSGMVDHVVIAALSNAYAGYVATREEYALQHYEGASTHFGPYALNAFQQRFAGIASNMAAGAPSAPGPTPRDIADSQLISVLGVVFDDVPLGKSFGDVETNVSASYARGNTVRVVFWGAHPRNNLRIQDTFLVVEKVNTTEVCRQEKVGCDTVLVCEDQITGYTPVAKDGDPETVYRWKRDGIANSKITITWKIPPNAAPGKYRIRHFGNWKSGWTGAISSYEGASAIFTVN
ncbi:MAG: alkaline ceramidase [Desulfobacteraceae bacterium]|jgi:neutral ceramidase|nr:MAG: alkaline ceramidase [Desulfobacteraceae bacterium]